MKSETLYAHHYERGHSLEDVRDLRFAFALDVRYSALRFVDVFQNNPLILDNIGLIAREEMTRKLFDLGLDYEDHEKNLIVGFGDNELGGRGRRSRYIYSTNDKSKIIVRDEADIENSIITDEIVSLVRDISESDMKDIQDQAKMLKSNSYF